MLWRDGVLQPQPESDRACLYGDGLFETMALVDGGIAFWSLHWARLARGLAALHFPALNETEIFEALLPALAVAEDWERGVLRLSVSRAGVRGYRISADARVVIQVQLSPWPTQVWHGQQLTLRWCQTRWAQQPLLAGIKHLNRLEQVLARSEWSDDQVAEGLVCDTAGQVVSGTQSALLLRHGQRVLASDLQACGIDSVARRAVMNRLPGLGYEVVVQPLTVEQVLTADEVWVMNAIQGIGLVARIEDHVVPDDCLGQELVRVWPEWAFSCGFEG